MRQCSLWASFALGLFVVVIVVEHAVNRRLSPLTHTISEYANGRAGVLMTAGFVAWSISLVLTAACPARVAMHRRAVASALLRALLMLAAVGAAVTAVFHTQTSAGELPAGIARSTAGQLHDLGSGGAILAIAAAALLSAWVVRRPASFPQFAVAVLMAAVIVSGVGLWVGDSVDGVRQRLLLLLGCLWQFALLRSVRVDRGQPGS